ncbi:DNA polymerase III subunit delta' [Pseudomonas sp. SGAir0191]|uniref:DNA polymerase III subunit delta' n=1 Tax=Pseudomonas sp. SGAir0191 TaxID=2217867 RepID=UPI000C2C36E7|nr:DNA polymerase III subunit delta' [Pseudomonas sp. SGAir0191]AUA32354.1 DNA polymerase III subunit delta' [Pseudomonas sp. SGAir0191]
MADAYPWQQTLWEQLAGRAQHAHAYLLHGPKGIGKRDLAERLMARLLCQRPNGTLACGQCKSCHLLKAGSHPDNFMLEPEELDKPIKVDQVRELVAFVAQTAQLGGRKVVMIEPVESMNVNASNALLKSLEEPSGDTVLLLVTHQPSRLLPTIKSRCQQVTCPLPTKAQSHAWLASALPETDQARRDDLLTLSAGSPLLALSLHQQGVHEQRALVTEGVKKLLKQQQSPSQLADAWTAVPLLIVFDWFFDWAQLILRYQLTEDDDELGMADMRKVVQYLAQKSRPAKVLEAQAWILEQRQKVLGKANLNRALLIESLLAHWLQLPTGR